MKVSPNDPCPCGSGAKLKRCCRPVLQGGTVTDPRALVRARYTAYVLAKVRFLVRTTHPSAPHYQADRDAWEAELRDHCRRVRFEGLTIHAHEVDAGGDAATVTFSVVLTHDGRPAGFREHSRFLRDGSPPRWRYVEGELQPLT